VMTVTLCLVTRTRVDWARYAVAHLILKERIEID
jgi:hypothetical protein